MRKTGKKLLPQPVDFRSECIEIVSLVTDHHLFIKEDKIWETFGNIEQ